MTGTSRTTAPSPLAAEGGYQWSDAAWTPWLRGGVDWFSGNGNVADREQRTFFPMLPTVRRYAQSTLSSTATLRDLMVQTILRPQPSLTLRVDAHALALARRADGWYAGSGATQEAGRIFGYSLRPSGGRTRLMELVEGSFDWRTGPHWSLDAYVGVLLCREHRAVLTPTSS